VHRYDGGPLQDRKITIDLWELAGTYNRCFPEAALDMAHRVAPSRRSVAVARLHNSGERTARQLETRLTVIQKRVGLLRRRRSSEGSVLVISSHLSAMGNDGHA
jgi:hypothetical protein